jgi:PAS domain S-box-containing protein
MPVLGVGYKSILIESRGWLPPSVGLSMTAYKAVFDYAPNPILLVDAEGRILQVNATGEKTLGYGHGELIGCAIETVIPKRFGAAIWKQLEHFMAEPHAGPMGTGVKLYARRKNGIEFPVEVTLNATSTPKGQVVIAVLRDISSERKKSAKRFRKLLERVQLSAEAAGMGYWDYIEATDEFSCDKVCASLLGGRPEDFPNAESVLRRIFHEDRDRRQNLVLKSLRLEGRYESEFRVVHPDGSVHWLGDLGRHIETQQSGIRRFAGVTFDITERKNIEAKVAETQLREKELLEQAPDGVFLADFKGKYTDVNSAGCLMLGMAREEIIGKTIMDLIPPEDVVRLAKSKDVLISGKSHVAEWSLRRKDGSYLPVEVSAKIFPDGRWQGFVRDISQRKQMEREQAELIRSLQNSLKEIKVLQGLLSICSHCKKIRDDSGHWQQMEAYVRDHSNADFSHSVCPVCMEAYYPDFAH